MIQCALFIHIFSTNNAFCGSGNLKAKELISIFNKRSSKKTHSRRSENLEPGTELQDFNQVPLTLPDDIAPKIQSHLMQGIVVRDPQDSRRVTLDLNSPRDVSANERAKQRGIRCLSFLCIAK